MARRATTGGMKTVAGGYFHSNLGNVLGNPMAKVALAGVAAVATQRLMRPPGGGRPWSCAILGGR